MGGTDAKSLTVIVWGKAFQEIGLRDVAHSLHSET